MTGLAPLVLWLQIPGSLLAGVEIVSKTRRFGVQESLLHLANYYTEQRHKLLLLVGPYFLALLPFLLNECFKGVINRLVTFFKCARYVY